MSNARIRSYFGFDPVEFVDDIVVATSEYINGSLESLAAAVSVQDMPIDAKEKFMGKVNSRMQRSLNINSDLLEMYVMRNIFWIDVDVDMAAELRQADKSAVSISVDMDYDDGTDRRLKDLYAEISSESSKRTALLHAIDATEKQCKVAEQIVARRAEIDALLGELQSLPTDRVESAVSVLQSYKDLMNSRPARRQPSQSFVFN